MVIGTKNIIPELDVSADSDGNIINPATKDNQINGLQKTQNVDISNRMSFNTVFGEKIIGIRKAQIAAQFQYGFPSGSATPMIVNGGTISIIESMLTLTTGTNIAGSACIINKKALRYLPGHEAFIVFTTIFTQGVADSYQRSGIFDDNNGFFIGFEGIDFKVTRRRAGIDTSYTITLNDVFDGFNPTKGNIYRISFGYLGFATIHFEVMLPNGGWTKLYEMQYPNSAIVTHITNTNLQPRLEVANTGNNTNIIVKTGSFSAGIVDGGGEDPASRLFSFVRTEQTIVAGTLRVVMFRSRDEFNSLTNYIQSLFTLLSFNADLSKSSSWELRKNMTITNTPTWTNISINDSTIEYSTNMTVTDNTGILLFGIPLGKVDRILMSDLEKQVLELLPQETLILTIKTPLGTSGTYDFSLRWKELF